MLQVDNPADYLISSGTTTSLKQFVEDAFEVAGLTAENHLETLEALKRPADLQYSAMNPKRIKNELGWSSTRSTKEIVRKMYFDELF